MVEANHINNDHALYWASACERLMRNLKDYALGLANGRSYDADDLVQETVCRALIYSRNPAEIKNPLGYLLRSMRHVWISKWRKENRARTESLDELQSKMAVKNHPTVEPEVFRILENQELALKLRSLPGKLTDREKELIELYFFRGYSRKEMAAILAEDLRVTSYDLNRVINKVHQRVKRVSNQPEPRQKPWKDNQ